MCDGFVALHYVLAEYRLEKYRYVMVTYRESRARNGYGVIQLWLRDELRHIAMVLSYTYNTTKNISGALRPGYSFFICE